jgi:hypothetical protein
MKTVILAVCLSLVSAQAMAISRYNSQSMSCGKVQSVVDDEGAVILRYTSASGNPLYDRYVRNAGFCAHNEGTRVMGVPAKDTSSCPVLKCWPLEYDDDDWNTN